MAERGSYAKGVAKREMLLTRALEVVAREGYGGASVKEISAAAGLSQAGLLHYFGSKEELFVAILRKRDELDGARYGVNPDDEPSLEGLRAGYLRIIRHNSEVPGLVQLYSRLAVAATAPDHIAHEFFLERNATLRPIFTAAFERAQQAGTITDEVDADTLARIFQAVADGLQLQWLLEPDLDMAAIVDALFAAISRPHKSAPTEP